MTIGIKTDEIDLMRLFLEAHCLGGKSGVPIKHSSLAHVGEIVLPCGTLDVYATDQVPANYTTYWREMGKVHKCGLLFVETMTSIRELINVHTSPETVH